MHAVEISVDCLSGLASPGDLLLYRDSRSIEDVLIGRGGRSPYAHAGMLARKGEKWIVLEMDQWKGGRWRSLDQAVRELRDGPPVADDRAQRVGDRALLGRCHTAGCTSSGWRSCTCRSSAHSRR